ncbi:MAG TPA: tRNA uridine-5-carboxymethylaminomethyl(34) synthesis GTPase MnmE [Sphingomicrobium sp.]|nr:tRNA uridine-5-carboxymethylaminomethyl(34) synthesis GTPase MnmE [Sphingomicrobium sp.]
MSAAAVADTIVALSSGRLPAAIAIIRTSGPAALAAAERLTGGLTADRTAHLKTLRDPRDGSLIDRAIVLAFPAPETSTGEDVVEYQCHGGKAVVAAVIAALTSLDHLREAEPGEFTRRALANGKIDLTQAEGLAELLEAETEAQRKSALARSQGVLRAQIETWREAVLAQSAQLEVAIDYSDEEDGADTDLSLPLLQLAREMSELLEAPRVEKLRDGVRVVIAGAPNSGKSSLFNAIAGQDRAIVTPIAGTTRDRIEAALAIDGVAVVLVDTAGLRDTDDPVEGIGVELAQREAVEADVLIWLGPGAPPAHSRLVNVTTKSDLGAEGAGLTVSSLTGENISKLKTVIAVSATGLVPGEAQLALNAREATLLADCRDALLRASTEKDLLFAAEELRASRYALDMISGLWGVEALLDALFSRFCLGK